MEPNEPVVSKSDPQLDPRAEKPKFQAQMPAIPGVTVGHNDHSTHPPKMWTMFAVAAIVVSAMSGVWWFVHDPTSPQGASLPAASANTAPPIASLPPAPAEISSDGATIARVSEFEKPWSSKEFIYSQPATHEQSRAIIVKLPGNARSHESYWALLLQEPFGTCELQYVTDKQQLADKYAFAAQHPMIVDPCTSARLRSAEDGHHRGRRMGSRRYRKRSRLPSSARNRNPHRRRSHRRRPLRKINFRDW